MDVFIFLDLIVIEFFSFFISYSVSLFGFGGIFLFGKMSLLHHLYQFALFDDVKLQE